MLRDLGHFTPRVEGAAAGDVTYAARSKSQGHERLSNEVASVEKLYATFGEVRSYDELSKEAVILPISPLQVRAARAMLDWSMLDLARAAGVSVSTVKRFDDEASVTVTAETVALMRDALETEGVRFLPDDGNGPGVRCRRR